MVDELTTAEPQPEAARISRGPTVSLGLLIFGFGTAAGFLLAFSGLGVIEDGVGIILLIFLCVLLFIGAFGLILVLFRKPLLRRLFGFAETQLELFAEPLARVTKGAVDRDPDSATQAARDLVHMALARYAWISTRRWIIGSLTALIAAMAALAGTMLLFRQNELLADQSVLFREQNLRIDNQIVLETYSVQLAEAARNAQLVVEITSIASALGDILTAKQVQDGLNAASAPVLDPAADLDLGLVMRITSASRATKPYRFLQTGLNARDENAVILAAMERRRADLPQTLERMNPLDGAAPPDPNAIALVDRPASPERGQLLTAMTQAGIRSFETFNFFGLDLSYAYAPGMRLFSTTYQAGELSYADFTFGDIFESDFAGSFLLNTRFRSTFIRDSNFGAVPGAQIEPPFDASLPLYITTLTGADFTSAMIRRTNFSEINGLAMNFDNAVLIGADFTRASIAASTFRGTVLLGVDFTDANLSSVDFDGAYMVGADALTRLQEQASPGSFRPERFVLDPLEPSDAFDNQTLYRHVDSDELLAEIGPAGLFRVRRVQPFEN
ncbi:MAG: pentapeptide repeat-containing protein [Pseudomonadota bacterium]